MRLYFEVREQAINILLRGTLQMCLHSHIVMISPGQYGVQHLIFNAFGVWGAAYTGTPSSVIMYAIN